MISNKHGVNTVLLNKKASILEPMKNHASDLTRPIKKGKMIRDKQGG